jgi:sugar phosphate isomerase/epimerase
MHERISFNSICYVTTTLSEQADYWRSLEARRVSLLGAHIVAEGLGSARQALATGSYGVESIVHPFLPGQGLDPDPSTWEAPRASLNALIDTARQLGARSIYMTTGGHGGMVWEQAAETFANAVAPCIEQAKFAGVALLIENAPTLYADIHLAHSLRDTVTLAEMAGVGVCIDLCGCWTEADLRSTIERALPNLGLVQFSDYVLGDKSLPSRAVPGDGDMPLARLLDWILSGGYEGAFDLELLGPRIDEEGHLQAAHRAGVRTGELLRTLGA